MQQDRPDSGWSRLEHVSMCDGGTPIGRHMIAELYDCDQAALNDVKLVERHLISAAQRSRATVFGHLFHKFGDLGVSGVVVIGESHLSIHTWPEYAYAAVDFFTCGTTCRPQRGIDYLIDVFQAKSGRLLDVDRGMACALGTGAKLGMPTNSGASKCF